MPTIPVALRAKLERAKFARQRAEQDALDAVRRLQEAKGYEAKAQSEISGY